MKVWLKNGTQEKKGKVKIHLDTTAADVLKQRGRRDLLHQCGIWLFPAKAVEVKEEVELVLGINPGI